MVLYLIPFLIKNHTDLSSVACNHRNSEEHKVTALKKNRQEKERKGKKSGRKETWASRTVNLSLDDPSGFLEVLKSEGF